ncbi:MAG: hypothetical protein ACOX6T_12655 [Myxococcales bacterium]|jgi:hypothetical protein
MRLCPCRAVAVTFLTVTLLCGCASTRTAKSAPALPEAERHQALQALRDYLLAPDAWSQPGSAVVLGALASQDPDAAFLVVEGSGFLTDDTAGPEKHAALGSMLRALPESHREAWLRAHGDTLPAELEFVLFASLPRPPIARLQAALGELPFVTDDVKFVLLLLSAKTRALGMEGWEKLRPAGFETTDPFQAQMIGFLEGVIDSDPKRVAAFFTQRSDEDTFARYKVLETLIEVLGEEASVGVGASILDAARVAEPDERFVMAALALPYLPEAQKAEARAVAAQTWRPELIAKPFGLEHAAAFHAMEGLLYENPQLAKEIFRSLVDVILGWDPQETGMFFHAVGTAAGVIARIDPALALETAERIRSLEWQVHAKRCIYRAWARVHPAEALAKPKGDPNDFDGRIAHDLQLEAAVGAGMAAPALALQALDALPDHPDRFEQGVSLVAASMAATDPQAAVALLLQLGKSIDFHTALALAWLVAADRRAQVFETRATELADWIQPLHKWPGPFLSQSLRFGDPLPEFEDIDIALPPGEEPAALEAAPGAQETAPAVEEAAPAAEAD